MNEDKMNKDKTYEELYIGYIDGTLPQEREKELEEVLDSGKDISREELFELKDIADTARHGSMPVRRQERSVLELLQKAEKADRHAKRRRRLLAITGYAAVAITAFIAGAGIMSLRTETPDSLMTVSAGVGNKTDIVLPDGTQVTLKSSSVLTYDAKMFGRTSRSVTLDGEAFFDVTKDPERKFTVRTQRQDVTVHGTSFNLQAYDDDKSNTLTLLEGNVTIDLYDRSRNRIRSLDINPMERCTWDLRTGRTSVEKIDHSEMESGWKDNVYCFKDKSISELAERLEQYFDLSITTTGLADDTERFSGAFSLNQDIREIMKMLNYDHRYSIRRIDERHYRISEAEKPR